MLIEAGWRGRPDFKAAIGGEALTRPLAEALVARSAGLWNLYGPTEASIFCIGCSVRVRRRAGADRAADREHAGLHSG